MVNECSHSLWKEHLKKKGEAHKNAQRDFRVSVIDKLVNNSFETITIPWMIHWIILLLESLKDSLKISIFLRKSQYLKIVKREEYFEHAKYACSPRDNSIVSDVYQNVNVQGHETQLWMLQMWICFLHWQLLWNLHQTQKDYMKKNINEFLKWTLQWILTLSDCCRICSCIA